MQSLLVSHYLRVSRDMVIIFSLTLAAAAFASPSPEMRNSIRVEAASPAFASLYRELWVSHFTKALFADPEALSRIALTNELGTAFTKAQDISDLTKVVSKYGKLIPGAGTAVEFTNEFAKDFDVWAKSGIEYKKQWITRQYFSNPEMFYRLANSAFDLLQKESGAKLTPNETAFLRVLRHYSTEKGLFVDTTASLAALRDRVNSNLLIQKLFEKLDALPAAEFSAIVSSETALKKFVETRLGGVAPGFAQLTARTADMERDIRTLVKQNNDRKRKQEELDDLQREFTDLEAGAHIVTLLVGFVDRGSGERLGRIAEGALHICRLVALAKAAPNIVTPLGMISGVMNALSLMVGGEREVSVEGQHQIRQALASAISLLLDVQTDIRSVRQLLHIMRADLLNLQQQQQHSFATLRQSIEQLRLDVAAIQADHTIGETQRLLRAISQEVVQTRTLISSRSFNVEDPASRLAFETHLTTLLWHATFGASMPPAIQLESPRWGDSQISVLRAALGSGESAENFLAALDNVPVRWSFHDFHYLETLIGRVDSASIDEGEPRFNVIVWASAVQAYAEARERVPQYIPIPDSPIRSMEQQARAMGLAMHAWLDEATTIESMSHAIQEYRKAASALFARLHALVQEFTNGECSRRNKPRYSTPESQSWRENLCRERTGGATVLTESLWFGSDVDNTLILLDPTRKLVDASFSTRNIAIPRPEEQLNDHIKYHGVYFPWRLYEQLRGWWAADQWFGSSELRNRFDRILPNHTCTNKNFQTPQCPVKRCEPIGPEFESLCFTNRLVGCVGVNDQVPGRSLVIKNCNVDTSFTLGVLKGNVPTDFKVTDEAFALRAFVDALYDNESRRAWHLALLGPSQSEPGPRLFVVNIQNVDPNGTIGTGRQVSLAFQVSSSVEGVDSWDIFQFRGVLAALKPELAAMRVRVALYLSSREADFRPQLDDLNRAYARLTVLFILQMRRNGWATQASYDALHAMISGEELQGYLRQGYFGEVLVNRLFLINPEWGDPFKSTGLLAELEQSIELPTEPCRPATRREYLLENAVNSVALPEVTRNSELRVVNGAVYWRNYLRRTQFAYHQAGFDLYCRMWDAEMSANAVTPANSPRESPAAAHDTGGIAIQSMPYLRGSEVVTRTLEYLYGVDNMLALRKALLGK